MALFGAKQIHPRALEPLVAKKIPLRIRNAFNLKNPGTLVTANPQPDTQKTVKCVSAIRHTGLVDVRGGSMVGPRARQPPYSQRLQGRASTS